MTDPQVPRIPDLMVPAIEGLASGLGGAARQTRIRHANHGRYGDIARGLAAQAGLTRARLTREIMATRLFAQNTGQPLRDLVASEYFATLKDEPQYAVGEVQLVRQKTNTSSSTASTFMQGVVPKGTKITRVATATYIPAPDADYVTTEDVVCPPGDTFAPVDQGGGNWLHSQYLTAPIIASRPGVDANTPSPMAATIGGSLFDSGLPLAERLTGGSIHSAGGALGLVDPQVLGAGRALGAGRSGATNFAALAGVLSDPRARRVAAKLDYATAILWLYVGDASWSTSARFRDEIKRTLIEDKWLGFGARVAIGGIVNNTVSVKATVVLRSSQYLSADRSAIQQAIQSALQAYFDDRRDWYTWRINAIGGVIARADSRILTCQNPQVISGDSGAPMADPSNRLVAGASSAPHWWLTGLNLNFAQPGA